MLEINNRIKMIQIILFALKVSQMMMQKLSGEKVRIMILSIVKLSPMEQIMHIASAMKMILIQLFLLKVKYTTMKKPKG